MKYAAERLGQCCLGIIDFRPDLDCIDGRNGHVFSEAAWQSCDTVFLIECALVRIAGRAVFAYRISIGAHAIQSLVEDDPVTGSKSPGLRPGIFDYSDDFVSEDLRLFVERYYSAAVIGIVV